MTCLVADYPALKVFSGVAMKLDLQLIEARGYCRTVSTCIVIRAFPNDKYEWLRKFHIGCDNETGVWAFGAGAMITSEKRDAEVAFGYELGDKIQIEGTYYTIEAAPNHNIKFVEVT
jgi:hypothetical protein